MFIRKCGIDGEGMISISGVVYVFVHGACCSRQVVFMTWLSLFEERPDYKTIHF